VVDLKSHNTAFCRECFFLFVERQVGRAIREHRMLTTADRVLVCVSGGKDSLALWDILQRMGYRTDGLYIDLGIPGYSTRSREKIDQFAAPRGLRPIVVSLGELSIPIPELARRNRRAECSVCGTVKRHFFNRVARESGYTVVATGHNLDDEAGRLLGNILHWQMEYLSKQSPVLPAVGELLVRRVERRTDKSGKPYLSLVLGDKSGDLPARVWSDVLAKCPGPLAVGDYVGVQAQVGSYQGEIQLTVLR